MKPTDLNNNETNQDITEEKSHKKDFMAIKKKVVSENFTLDKDVKSNKKLPTSWMSYSISSLLILLTFASIITFVYYFSPKAGHQENNKLVIPEKISQNNINTNFSNIPKLEKIVTKPYDLTVMSKAIGIYELNTGKVVFEQNADQKLPFASITKLFTVETMRSFINPNTQIKMSPLGFNILGSKLNIPAGEKINYNDAIYAMMMASANDVALSVAEQYGYDNFVQNMNNLAKSLNLNDTSLTSPIGFDDPQNYSSVRDIFTISKLYLKNQTDQTIAKTAEYTIKSDKNSYAVENTNNLLMLSEVFGLKTGTEDKAGQCLALYIKIQNREYIAILLGSQDRWKEGQKIVDWLKVNG
ncbi:MAG: hypothetical protein WCJ19_05515 [bacterium]